MFCKHPCIPNIPSARVEANCIMRGDTDSLQQSRNLRSALSILHRFCQCIRHAVLKAKTKLASESASTSASKLESKLELELELES